MARMLRVHRDALDGAEAAPGRAALIGREAHSVVRHVDDGDEGTQERVTEGRPGLGAAVGEGHAVVADARVIAFSSLAFELVGIEPVRLSLPPPGGSTALHLALQLVATGPRPARIVVVTDGGADDPQAASLPPVYLRPW